MSARPSLLSSNSSSRRPSAAPSSFPSLPSTRGSSTLGPTTPSAWGAPTPPAPAPEAPPRKKGPSLSLGPAARRTSAPIHPLQHTWEVWFSNRVAGQKGANKDDSKEKESREQWETGVVKLGFFSSVESLHPFLAHLTPPSLLPSSSSSTPLISDLNIFKSDIAPAWEDPSNVGGGRWVLRLRKGVADRVWDELVYALVGARLEPDGGSGVNGVVLSVRKDEDILSVWCKPAPRVERELVRDAIRTALSPLLTPTSLANLVLDYKPHPASSAPLLASPAPRAGPRNSDGTPRRTQSSQRTAHPDDDSPRRVDKSNGGANGAISWGRRDSGH